MEHGMDVSTSFGEWLKQRRTILHMSREQLAQRAGCAVITLRKIESDERRPSAQLAERLAVLLDVPRAVQPTFVSVARAELPVVSLPARLSARTRATRRNRSAFRAASWNGHVPIHRYRK